MKRLLTKAWLLTLFLLVAFILAACGGAGGGQQGSGSGSEQESAESKPQHVYLIHFRAHALWGERTSAHDSLYIDMWEDYLEPA